MTPTKEEIALLSVADDLNQKALKDGEWWASIATALNVGLALGVIHPEYAFHFFQGLGTLKQQLGKDWADEFVANYPIEE